MNLYTIYYIHLIYLLYMFYVYFCIENQQQKMKEADIHKI